MLWSEKLPADLNRRSILLAHSGVSGWKAFEKSLNGNNRNSGADHFWCNFQYSDHPTQNGFLCWRHAQSLIRLPSIGFPLYGLQIIPTVWPTLKKQCWEELGGTGTTVLKGCVVQTSGFQKVMHQPSCCCKSPSMSGEYMEERIIRIWSAFRISATRPAHQSCVY